MQYLTLDAHAHVSPQRTPGESGCTGAVLGMTLSLEEAGLVVGSRKQWIAWGPGCHPRSPQAQKNFDRKLFAALVRASAVVGEIGLDTGSRVPIEQQLSVFRGILEVLAENPRPASIHSYQATALVLEELRRTPISFPILHWWTGSADETSRAVELGCFFSVHSQVARQSKFHTRVPLERILVESDHGYNDPPAAIPCRIQWVEYLVAQQYKLSVEALRGVVWRNLARVFKETGGMGLLPADFSASLETSMQGSDTDLFRGKFPVPDREIP